VTSEAEHKGFVIVGGGIAGLSAAIALKLAGFAVTVFEREPTSSEIGAGIQIGPNAAKILAAWSVTVPQTFEPEGIELRNAHTGARLNVLPLHDEALRRYGAPYLTASRADLHGSLLQRVEELGVSVRFDRAVTAIHKYEDRVSVLAAGDEVEGAALIGADGLHSAVRSWIPFAPRPAATQTVIWRALLPPGAVSAPFRNTIAVWMGNGAHLVHYPIAGGSAINAVLAIDNDWYTSGAAPHSGVDGPSHFLTDRLRGWTDAPLSTIASSEDWQSWPIYRMPRFKGGRRRIQLIGDAWHAMPPFLAAGGALAIEDAAELASVLANGGGNVILDLDAFRKQRSRRVWRIQTSAAQMGRIYHLANPFAKLRDEVIRRTPGNLLLSRNDWIYGYNAI